MTIIINQKNAAQLKKLLGEKKEQAPQKGSLAKHFGKLKRGLNGLAYQQKIRENED